MQSIDAKLERRPRGLAAALALTLLLTLLTVVQGTLAPEAEASHFRSSQLSWTRTSANTAEFHSTIGVRRSFYGSPTVGSTIYPVSVSFGDGSSASPPHKVVALDAANDWILTEATFSKSYAGLGPYIAAAQTCCRLSAPLHINNPDANNRVETIVDLANTSASPVSSTSPIVDCALNALCSFTVPAFDADGQGLRWRMATSAEAVGFGTFRQPGPTHAPNAASVHATTGLYTWDTTGATLNASGDTYYSTQVIVENISGSAVVSKTAVDFFIRLGSGSSNQAPVFTAPTPADGTVFDVPLGTSLSFDVQATDPDAGHTVTLGMLGKPAAASFTHSPGNPASGSFAWTPTATGTVLLTLTAQDQLGLGATQRSITIDVTSRDLPPEVDAGPDVSGNEGSSIGLTGSVTDADSPAVTSSWSYSPAGGVDAGATCVFADAAAAATSITCTDDGAYTATLTADDGVNPPVTDTVQVTVANVAPTIAITAPGTGALYAVNTPVALSTGIGDAGANDTHTCDVVWDDGSTDSFAAAGSCDRSHTFTAAGVYSIVASVTDDDGGTDSASVMVVVYDPSAGFVTGGGTLDSPAGAYRPDPTLTGKANFGFVSKYKKGAVTPTGQTEFQFKAGSLNFHSSVYDWLVVSGAKAQYKGTGTINGSGSYGFLLTATDGQLPGGGGVDKLRMKIWDKSAGDTVVYDNAFGSSEDIDAANPQAISTGSIVIHK